MDRGIVAGREPGSIVARDAEAVAFMNLTQRPGNDGHVLVVPRPHVQTIDALDAAIAGAVFAMTAHIARAVKRVMQPDGVTVLQNKARLPALPSDLHALAARIAAMV